jgi:Bacterial TSP3 repeat
MKLTPPISNSLVAGTILLCLPTLAPAQAEPPPPPVAITSSPAGTKVRWKPSLDSVNFLQTSTDLRTWKYYPEAVSGMSATRELDFPFTPGSQFFRAITRAYSGTNAANEDFDGDGLLTRDEMLIFHTDPLAADSDGDGRSDGATDSDRDGIPDAAEILAGLDPHDASDAVGDSDQDGISNLTEHLAGTDPANPDTDNDTLTDAWEQLYGDPKVYSDPKLDTDGDGLTAKTEQLINTNPSLTDTNTNGINDGAEEIFLSYF